MNLKKIKDSFSWTETIEFENINDWVNLMTRVRATPEEAEQIRQSCEDKGFTGKLSCKLSTEEVEDSYPVGKMFLQIKSV